MSINDFGRVIRDARKETKETLLSMANALGCSVAFLSAIETGRSKIPLERIKEIEEFFTKRGYQFEEDLTSLAIIANDVLPLDGLDQQHKLLLTGFAKSNWDQEQLKRFAEFMGAMREELQKPKKGA